MMNYIYISYPSYLTQALCCVLYSNISVSLFFNYEIVEFNDQHEKEFIICVRMMIPNRVSLEGMFYLTLPFMIDSYFMCESRGGWGRGL